MSCKLLVATIFLLSLTKLAFSDVSINGYIQTDNRVRLEEPRNFTWNENRLGVKFNASPSDKLHAFSEVRLRGFGFPDTTSSTDLQDKSKDKVLPWGAEMREAYVDVYGFLTKKLDLRIGRQMIVWGTADKVNPTSNLCPDDLEDIFDFGEKLGVNALKASFYQKIGSNDLTLTGVFVPIFTPSTLPSLEWSSAFLGDMEIPANMKMVQASDRTILPEPKLNESSSFGVKLSTKILGYDLSLSYYNGRDKLPLVTSIFISPLDETLQTVNILAHTKYPKIQVIGADMAGEIGSAGIWAEGAIFIPNETEMVETFLTPPMSPLKTSVALDDKPYYKFVVGGDYNFKHGFYLNIQYIHGFIHERGKDNLNDYFVSRLEYKFHNDEVKIVPISFAVGVDDWNKVGDNYGYVYIPEISYSPYDNLEITLGAYLLDGKGGSLFSKVKDNDEFYFKAKMSF